MDGCLLLSADIMALLLVSSYIVDAIPIMWIPVASIVVLSLLAGWKISKENDWL